MHRNAEHLNRTRPPRGAVAALALAALLPLPACVDLSHLPGTAPTLLSPQAARLKKLGGTVAVDAARQGSPVVGVDLHRCRVTEADLELLAAFPELHTLNLYGTAVGDAEMARVGQLTGLKTLYLTETRVTDTGLANLAKLTGLRELGLDRTAVTDDGLVALGKMTSLEELTLSGDRVTDAGLKHLTGLKNLRHLALCRTGVTPDGVRELRRALPNAGIVFPPPAAAQRLSP